MAGNRIGKDAEHANSRSDEGIAAGEGRRFAAQSENWRTHPQAQRDALRGVLAEIGYADALLARELPDGSLELIDGHLRPRPRPTWKCPCWCSTSTTREAAKLLALHDPLAGMAEANEDVLAELLAEVETESEAVQAIAGFDAGRRTSRTSDADESARRRKWRCPSASKSSSSATTRTQQQDGLRANDERRVQVPAADAVEAG